MWWHTRRNQISSFDETDESILNRRGRQFSRLLAAEVFVSAVVMLDTPCSEVVWRVLATHSIRQFPLHFPSRVSPCAITFQLESIPRQRPATGPCNHGNVYPVRIKSMEFLCFLLGNSPSSEFYMPTFRNTLFHLHRQVGIWNLLTNCVIYAAWKGLYY